MAIKTIPLSRLETDLRKTLNDCADSGDTVVVEMPDHAVVSNTNEPVPTVVWTLPALSVAVLVTVYVPRRPQRGAFPLNDADNATGGKRLVNADPGFDSECLDR